MKLLTKSRIIVIRARAYAQFEDYTLIGANGQYTVTCKSEPRRSYSVDLSARTCDCPAFDREGFCKHCAMCQLEETVRERHEQWKAEWEAEREAYCDRYAKY